ncbi:ABC1 kinase family protein [Clostridium grantii]|uniref:Ubiquinone biosynthesis protein n=1 Tax=Clostridium grantii DSM 8605 TaxID=1121316 RepID=A0A1M5Y0R2_9CLOT|nr:AarF/ABC1/UbiB kinase family protein [Clostridium grantii]SHI05388.1 ubiquinone biosynthesis protein [Clostridium grantii DSM 8605]
MNKNSVSRFKEIARTLASYGFGYIVDNTLKKEKNNPANLRKAFEELGPTFIKIGQILSTRPDILSEKYIIELSKLQDSAIEEPFENIREILFQQFGKDINEIFLDFNKKPIASASISQVHKAKLKNGEEVIVKIQRPGIAEKMRLDISILYKLIKLTKTKFSDFLIEPLDALDELLYATEMELNFENEVKNIDQFKHFNKNVSFLSVPNIYYKYCTEKIITMEMVHGIKINNINLLKKNNYDLNDIGKKLTLSYFKQIFDDGYFHCDPHPGNILISDNKIYYIDFGLVGTLSDSLKSSLNEMVIAIAYQDISKLVSILISIGISKSHVNRNKLYEDVDYLLVSYLSTSLSNIKISRLLDDIFSVAKDNNIKLPREFTLLMRGLVILEGVVVKLSPDLKIMDIAIGFVKSKNKYSFLHDFSLDDSLIKLVSFTQSSSKLPSRLIELINSSLDGRLKLQLVHKNLDNPVNSLNKMINRLASSFIISSMIIGSALILNSNTGPKIYGMSFIGITGFIIAALFGFWLLISIMRSGKL